MKTRLILTAALLLVSTLAAAQPASNAALRIVVVEGEDAVNVVQQKTAVAPVIEVRDRNNLPVPGVLVTFSIQGGKAATFGGASTLTVATNAAGQAAVTSLTPTAAGAFQIQVSAAFQGQIATATIAQTNVMTAAQAAAVSGAGGGAGGGGLSTTTLAVTGAAVAGGAAAALQVVGKGDAGADEVFTGSFSGLTRRVTTLRNTGVTACVENYAMSGTVHFEIEDSSGDKVEGQMDITATDTLVSQTCPTAPAGMTVNWSVPFNGTDSSIHGTDTTSFSGPLPTGSIQGTVALSFEGARSGEGTITGTFRVEIRSTSVNQAEALTFDHIITGSFPLTLTKQGQSARP